MGEQVVYLNGQFMPISKASVPVLDRGFIFGDGVYDVIPVYQRKLFRSEQHLARLARSLAAVGIENIYSKDQWLSIIGRLLEEYDATDQMVYIQVTRGGTNITRGEVFDADEVLLSSAAKEILPVTRIDGKQVGNGKPGPLYARLYDFYQKAKAQQCH